MTTSDDDTDLIGELRRRLTAVTAERDKQALELKELQTAIERLTEALGFHPLGTPGITRLVEEIWRLRETPR